MTKFNCFADMGSVKIVGEDFNVCFSNGFGDGGFDVIVGKKPPKGKGNFEGHFTVKKENSVRIAEYDCGYDVFEYTFSIGRWFVFNYEGNIYIKKIDNETHA